VIKKAGELLPETCREQKKLGKVRSHWGGKEQSREKRDSKIAALKLGDGKEVTRDEA